MDNDGFLTDQEIMEYVDKYKDAPKEYLLEALEQDLPIDFHLYVRKELEKIKNRYKYFNAIKLSEDFIYYLAYLGRKDGVDRYHMFFDSENGYRHFYVCYCAKDDAISYKLMGDTTIISKSPTRTIVADEETDMNYALFYSEKDVKSGNNESKVKNYIFQQYNSSQSRLVTRKYDVSNQNEPIYSLPYLSSMKPKYIEYYADFLLFKVNAKFKLNKNREYQVVEARPSIFKNFLSNKKFCDDCFSSMVTTEEVPEMLIKNFKENEAIDMFHEFIEADIERNKETKRTV